MPKKSRDTNSLIASESSSGIFAIFVCASANGPLTAAAKKGELLTRSASGRCQVVERATFLPTITVTISEPCSLFSQWDGKFVVTLLLLQYVFIIKAIIPACYNWLCIMRHAHNFDLMMLLNTVDVYDPVNRDSRRLRSGSR